MIRDVWRSYKCTSVPPHQIVQTRVEKKEGIGIEKGKGGKEKKILIAPLPQIPHN